MAQNAFSTSDIVLAASLRCKGFRLEKIEKQGARGIFFFTEVDQSVLSEFDLGTCLVEPVMFNNAIKALTTAARRAF